MYFIFFFFSSRRRHTRCSRDWSSDVCSSDLYEFSSKGQKILFWGDTVHAQRVQLKHPEITAVFDIDPAVAAARRNQLLPRLAGEDVLIASPHLLFPGLGRLHKEGKGYSWAPSALTDQWGEK